MKTKKRLLSAEMLMAISALFISLVTVAISLYSAATDRAYARASVWPDLQVVNGNSIDNNNDLFEVTFSVNNNGTGPAIIKSIKLFMNNTPIDNWTNHIIKLPESNNDMFAVKSVKKPIDLQTLPPGKSLKIINATLQGKNEKSLYEIAGLFDDYSVELCFCSIYDECWKSRSNSTSIPVKACPHSK